MPDLEAEQLLLRRDRQLARRNGKMWDKLIALHNEVYQGFQGQGRRSDQILDWWDCYNCVLNQHQSYHGNAELYVPLIRAAVNARKTRFVNQMFPGSGRYIDATSTDAAVPHAIIALLEHYIHRARMKTEVAAALCRNGDIEGQYNLYIDWDRIARHVVSRETVPPQIRFAGLPVPVELPGMGETAEEDMVVRLVSETIHDEGPALEVLHDTDVLVLPQTADSVEKALAEGGSATILRRWTKGQVREMIEKKQVMRGPAEELLERATQDREMRDAAKRNIDAAGIKDDGKYIQGYETWKVIETEEGSRLCKILFGDQDLVLSATRNPHWNDRCPLLSVPVEKVAGAFKGQSPVSAVDTIQYHANDVANQAADSSTYSMLPIIMTDPASNPKTSTMILNLAAIWEVDPAKTKFAEFPKLWQDGIALIQADTQLVFQTLGVNPAMLPQQTGRPGAKRNQAEVALEQSVDIMTTSEGVAVVEQGILTPMLEFMLDFDQQYREDEITVRAFGSLGVTAALEKVPPIQRRTRYQFTWYGVEQARNAAQMQQQIAFLNVARGMAQELQKAGYTLNPAPALEHAAGNIFGWRQGRQIIVDARSSLSLGADLENLMLEQGMRVPVQPLDDDAGHLKSHIPMFQETGDPTGEIRLHVAAHMSQMQQKGAAMMQQKLMAQMPQGAPGMPQGGPQLPPGGAQPAGPRLVKGPPGMIPPEQMPAAGAPIPPRRF